MTIIANGKRREVATDSTVSDLLRSLRLVAEQVVIEYNGEPLQRDHFTQTRLRSDDQLEIAQMVGGG